MDERIKVITQKRTSLKAQLTSLQNLIKQENYDASIATLRLARVKELWENYEELHDELAVLSPEDERLGEIDGIRDRYFTLASQLKPVDRPSATQNSSLNLSTSQLGGIKTIKLPVAELPKFDGSLDHWLSYKNTFENIVDVREDISDLQKFLYLKNSLTGEALNKLSIYDVSADNYKNAWALLKGSYDRKRILIYRHLDAILDTPTNIKPTQKGLISLVGEMKQRVNALESLEVKPEPSFLIRILERALPGFIRVKWEETLTLDKFPSLEELYSFIIESAYRLLTFEQNSARARAESKGDKRFLSNSNTSGNKARRNESGARVLLTNTYSGCPLCKGSKHPLFRCSNFQKLNVDDRWKLVRKLNFCKNCLRLHNDACQYRCCRVCDKPHNALLHDPNHRATTRSKGVARDALRAVRSEESEKSDIKTA